MVFMFGVDIPLMEVILMGVIALLVVLIVMIVLLIWINRKEYDIIKEAEHLVDVEHEVHRRGIGKKK